MAIPKLRFPEFREAGEWKKKKLGEIVKCTLSGGTPSTQIAEFWQGNIPWITGADVVNQKVTEVRRFISEEAVKNSNTNIIQKDNLLVVTRTGVGKIAIAPFNLAISQDLTGIEIKEDQCKSEYLYRFIDHNSNALKSLNQGTSIAGITRETLIKMKVLTPSLSEQQKLIDCLSSLDDLIIAETQKLDSLKAHKKGLMQQLFPAEGETIPQLRFPEFREAGAWEVKKLGELLLNHPDYGVNAPAAPYSDNLPAYLRITDISDDGRYLDHKKVCVDIEAKSENYLVEGDIVLARTGASVGKSYKYRKEDGKLVFAGFLIRIRPNPKKVNSTFLFNFFYTQQYWDWVSVTSARSGQPGINGNEYASLLIPVPPSEGDLGRLLEQQKIADCLSSLDDLITAQTQKIEALKLHKKGLMQQLFPSVA